jgi:hypothetical protein
MFMIDVVEMDVLLIKLLIISGTSAAIVGGGSG